MPELWVPVSAKLREGTQDAEAQLRAMVRHGGGVLPYWNRELGKIDPHLRLVQAYESAEWPGLWPGYYALVRWNPGAPPSVMPLHGPNGEFVEPTGQMLDRLRESDLQNTAATHARRLLDEQEARARERAREREDEERREELQERLNAATRTQVSLNRQAAWTQNNSPAARRDARARRKTDR